MVVVGAVGGVVLGVAVVMVVVCKVTGEHVIDEHFGSVVGGLMLVKAVVGLVVEGVVEMVVV